MQLQVFVIDVGAPHHGNLGWANSLDVRGTDLDQCIDAINRVLPSCPVALGFEAPLYVPLRDDANRLMKARNFEGNRPWSAGAGPIVLSQGLVIMSYVFDRLIKSARPTFDPPRAPLDLQIFEAMVSSTGKPDKTGHVEDALHAVRSYEKAEVYDEGGGVMNLAAATLTRSGFAADLSAPMYVVKT